MKTPIKKTANEEKELIRPYRRQLKETSIKLMKIIFLFFFESNTHAYNNYMHIGKSDTIRILQI